MDYRVTTTLLTFGSCETSKCIRVTIVNDNIAEHLELFHARLVRTANLDSRITIDPNYTGVVISDDDI